MTTKTLDDVIRRILNDPDIFGPPYDKDARSALPLLFEVEKWRQLKGSFTNRDRNSFNFIVDSQCKELQQKENKTTRWREGKIRAIIGLGKSLKDAYEQKPYILEQMFDKLDSFGLVECKLPNMEDYGKVIENHSLSTVERYFVSKIDRAANADQRRALRKTLEYVKEMYAMDLDVIEIAFFVRKLNSLSQFIELIKDE